MAGTNLKTDIRTVKAVAATIDWEDCRRIEEALNIAAAVAKVTDPTADRTNAFEALAKIFNHAAAQDDDLRATWTEKIREAIG